MDARQAAHNLNVIRTLMERTRQYQLLTARAGLVAGLFAGAGALSFVWLDAADAWTFGIVWSCVFVISLLAVTISAILRGHQRGEPVWSRQARAVVLALTPALFAALVLSVLLFALGLHLWLPGVWMLCYGQGALATSAYSPASIRWLGVAFLGLGVVAFLAGPGFAAAVMGIAFGLGHIGLGLALLLAERREGTLRLHRSVA